MSSANSASASDSVAPANALPPYFTTMTLLANLRIYGKASMRTAARDSGDIALEEFCVLTGKPQSKSVQTFLEVQAQRWPLAMRRLMRPYISCPMH